MPAATGDVQGKPGDSITFTVPEKRRTAGLWIVAIIAGLQLLLFAGLGLREGEFPWVAALALSVSLLAALGVVYWLSRRVYDPRELKLVVSREGIHAPRMAESLVPWSAIESMAIEPYYSGPFGGGLVLRLHVPDPARYGPRGSSFVRRMSHWRFGSDLLFPVSGLDRRPEDVADAIKRFAPGDLMPLNKPGG